MTWWKRIEKEVAARREDVERVTGYLVSESGNGIAPVLNGNVHTAFQNLTDVTTRVLGTYDLNFESTRTPCTRATYYTIQKGQTLTRECMVKEVP